MTVKELFYSNLDRLTCRSSSVVFLREESLVLFVAARPVWNVVLFSSGRKVFCLNRLSPFDEFGTLCRFLREERLCLSSLNWTSCLTSRHSTNLELRAVLSRDIFFYLYCLSSLDELGMSCCFLPGGN